jgi:nucleoid-associated protein YgaU
MKKKTATSLILSMLIFVFSGCQTTPTPIAPAPSPLPGLPLEKDINLPPDPTPEPTPTPEPAMQYKIKKGDTLAKIAKKVYGDSSKWRIIIEANPDINPKNLKPGDEIKIPQNGDVVLKSTMTPETKSASAPCKKYDCYEHTIEPGQSLMDVSALYYGTHHKWHIIAKANRIGKKTALKVGQKIKVPKTDKFRKPDKHKVEISLPANYKYEEYKIRKGDNLGLIANKFYKDSAKWPYIAKANSIDRKTVLNVGQTIKIPVINGFVKIEKTEKKPVKGSDHSVQPETAKKHEAAADSKSDKITEENITTPKDDGIKLYNNKQYKKAIAEFNKAIKNKADDQEAIRYLSMSHFQLGEELFAQKDYMAAKTEYEQSLKYDSKCSECKPNIEKCVKQYCEDHYKKGEAYFKAKQPGKAYDEWKLVTDANPEYKNINKLIKLVETFKKK